MKVGRVQVSDYRRTLRPLPLLVQLGLTYRCNLRCAHCYAVDRRNRVEMPVTRFERLAEELHGVGAIALVYSHGENLLRRDFHQIAEAFRDLRFHQTLMSNGYFIRTAAAARALRDVGVGRCMISVDSVSSKVHDAVRGRPGAHAIALRAVDCLVGSGMPVVGFSTTIGAHNYNGLEHIVELAIAHGCTAVSLMHTRAARLAGEAGQASYRETYAAIYELILKYRDIIDVYTHDPFMLTLLDDRINDNAARAGYIGANLCNVGKSMVSIDPAGNVLACNFLATVYGNVLKEPFDGIWDRLVARTRNLRSDHDPACPACDLVELCGGGCPAHRESMPKNGCPYPNPA